MIDFFTAICWDAIYSTILIILIGIFTYFGFWMTENEKGKYSLKKLLKLISISSIILPLVIIEGFLIFYPSAILYNQIIYWLKFDKLIDVSLYACLTGKGPVEYLPLFSNTTFSEWLVLPQDWLGLHSLVVPILKFIPVWAIGYLIAFVFPYICISIGKQFSKLRTSQK